MTLPNKNSAIVHVAAGGNLSACVDSDGSLVYWGCISEHQDLAVRQPSQMQVSQQRSQENENHLYKLMLGFFRG